MKTITGRHLQADTGRRLDFWATFDALRDGVHCAAIVTEAGEVVAVPDFCIETGGRESTPGLLVRQHLAAYLDAMPFSNATVACAMPTR